MEDRSALKSSTVHELKGDEFWPLSGKPYFDIVLCKSHVNPPCQMYLSSKLLPYIPSGPYTKPAVLSYRGKKWKVMYRRGSKRHSFQAGWKRFVIENELKIDDACVFELSNCTASKLRFKVQILRGDFPSELLGNNEDGETLETPIIID